MVGKSARYHNPIDLRTVSTALESTRWFTVYSYNSFVIRLEMDQHSDSPQVSRFAPQAPRLLDRLRDVIRARHYSRRTEKTYRSWVRYFIFFHGNRNREEMVAAQST